MRNHRRVFTRLDQLIIGAARTEPRRSAVIERAGCPLSDKERIRLSELTTRRQFEGPLTPAEYYEREQLRQARSQRRGPPTMPEWIRTVIAAHRAATWRELAADAIGALAIVAMLRHQK